MTEAAAPSAAPTVLLAVAVLVALGLLLRLPPCLPLRKTGATAGAPVPPFPFPCPRRLPPFTIVGACRGLKRLRLQVDQRVSGGVMPLVDKPVNLSI